ncbi:MAG: metallophosphoesterase [Gammaproteobacteria bacterium]
MRINILSDLHLRQGSLAPPRTDADVVILAGDVDRPEQAIAWAGEIRQPVIYVPGNHEFYGSSLPATLAEIKSRAADTRIRVLDCEEWAFGGVRFLGATLWTDFALAGTGAKRAAALTEARKLMRDFSRIESTEKPGAKFTPLESMHLFREHSAWLTRKLAERFDGPTVVITHHAPSTLSIHPRYAGSALNGGFVSDLEYLMGRERVVLWVHGHTHNSFDYRVRGTRVICNPRGYARGDVNENPEFDPALIVSV